ncbi:MAG: hypothetical protein HZA29_05085 [Candidatus Omnitrophica bacterium]|nr:hypothetical protein [Candidatus Omnitrophota bacterium]
MISRHFELMIQELANAKGNRLVPAVLTAIAGDKHKMDDLCEELSLTKSHLSTKVTRLMEEGLISRNGNLY